AAFTTLPVIGVPIKARTLDGLDSLLSMVQMPSGIPVATVSIDGAKNAALLAIEIMAVTDKNLEAKMADFRKKQAEKVLASELN
ncbi:MAG: AIR carboxylase family protein, partial [Muribaculaceae bacterium]|nr:AIR carboxylase family protein [Muribaculaceae bacterium]